jgi:hypothetical protein
MKKLIRTISLFTFPLLLCSNSIERGVWVDESTFRVSGTGYAGKGYTGVQGRASACEAARLDAVAKMIIKFAETGIESVRGKVKTEIFKDVVKREFSGTMRGGMIVNSTYDNASGKCVVIYELKEKEMKKKIIKLAGEQGR